MLCINVTDSPEFIVRAAMQTKASRCKVLFILVVVCISLLSSNYDIINEQKQLQAILQLKSLYRPII